MIKIGKIIGIQKHAGKVRKGNFRKAIVTRLPDEMPDPKTLENISDNSL